MVADDYDFGGIDMGFGVEKQEIRPVLRGTRVDWGGTEWDERRALL